MTPSDVLRTLARKILLGPMIILAFDTKKMKFSKILSYYCDTIVRMRIAMWPVWAGQICTAM